MFEFKPATNSKKTIFYDLPLGQDFLHDEKIYVKIPTVYLEDKKGAEMRNAFHYEYGWLATFDDNTVVQEVDLVGEVEVNFI